MSLILLV